MGGDRPAYRREPPYGLRGNCLNLPVLMGHSALPTQLQARPYLSATRPVHWVFRDTLQRLAEVFLPTIWESIKDVGRP